MSADLPIPRPGHCITVKRVYRECDSIILGKKTDENMNVWLRGVAAAAVAGEEGTIEGVNGSHLTSHCTRKGSTSYVVSLPGLSNVIAYWLRAGWQLGGFYPLTLLPSRGVIRRSEGLYVDSHLGNLT